MKIAIVHDFLNQYGGAERVVEAFHEAYPDAPIYTSIFLKGQIPSQFRKMDIRTTFMQWFPFLRKYFKAYFLIYPFAFKTLDLSEYDVVLSSSSAYAKEVRVPRKTIHICYCHSPARFIWKYDYYMAKERISGLGKSLVYFATRFLKKIDIASAQEVDYFISNSQNTGHKIKTFYHRGYYTIYPPVNTERFYISEKPKDYFLMVARMAAYKRLDIVIKAFNELRLPLRIIGTGPHEANLRKIAGPTIEFLGKVDETDLAIQYSECEAYILPGEEDFGITPLEAQASGRPVIAYKRGGALETVQDGRTGVFFSEQTEDSLKEAITRYLANKSAFDPQYIREHAVKFDREMFIANIKEFVKEKYEHRYPSQTRLSRIQNPVHPETYSSTSF